ESVGLSRSTLVMGKHSGRHAFGERIKELGYEISSDDLEKAFERFKRLADKKKEVFDEDIEAIVQDEVIRIDDTEDFRLLSLDVRSGTETHPVATVSMEVHGQSVSESLVGDGPVDAAYRAIKKLTNTRSKLLKYSVNAITGGTDAQGEVTVRISEGDTVALGQGAHTDIILASAKAYVNALNRLEYRKRHNRESLM
ncbi:MAG: alpha-isopropylmalate synthase regulatory domain-containing protein, partial [Thermodesulfobacteriota bacterium]